MFCEKSKCAAARAASEPPIEWPVRKTSAVGCAFTSAFAAFVTPSCTLSHVVRKPLWTEQPSHSGYADVLPKSKLSIQLVRVDEPLNATMIRSWPGSYSTYACASVVSSVNTERLEIGRRAHAEHAHVRILSAE
eukprot:1331270-Prymnesium_polylepis.1